MENFDWFNWWISFCFSGLFLLKFFSLFCFSIECCLWMINDEWIIFLRTKWLIFTVTMIFPHYHSHHYFASIQSRSNPTIRININFTLKKKELLAYRNEDFIWQKWLLCWRRIKWRKNTNRNTINQSKIIWIIEALNNIYSISISMFALSWYSSFEIFLGQHIRFK